jgi:glycosyltransferase involved in cell wall biosynthesis
MRILVAADVSPDPDSGAAGTELRTIDGLRALGHEVDELWSDDLPHRVKHGNLHYLLELPRGYRSAIRRRWTTHTYDVIHANQGHAFLAARDHVQAGRPGVFVCRSHGLDDHMERVLRPWRKRLGIRARSGAKRLAGGLVDSLLDRHMRLMAKYASGFLISSSLDRDYLIEKHGVAPERVGLVPQAPSELFRESTPPRMTETRLRRLLYVAGFNYVKGPQLVARSVNALAARGADFDFSWVCRGDEQARARALLSPAAASRTHFLAWMSQRDLRDQYDAHGIFLYPSLFDGFGKVFLEAMARAMCVITTPAGGMRDIVRDRGNGLIVPFGEHDAITRAIEALWAKPDDALAVSHEARRTALEYSWGRVARETVAFYERLLMLPRRTPVLA